MHSFDLNTTISNFIDGAIKILPALLAAYFAYRLWRQKAARERAESILKGCLLFRHFCTQLHDQFLNDPTKPNSVSIKSLEAVLDVVLVPGSLSPLVDKALKTYSLWQKGRWFGTSVDDEKNIEAVQGELQAGIDQCNTIINVLRSKQDSDLLALDFYQL